MCIHCGCGQPTNRHGSRHNITIGDVRRAMESAAHRKGGKGVRATAEEMRRMVLAFAGEERRD